MLPAGARVHIVELRRTSEGAQRARVVLVGQRRALGWVTMPHQPCAMPSPRTMLTRASHDALTGRMSPPHSARSPPRLLPAFLDSWGSTPLSDDFCSPRRSSRRSTPRCNSARREKAAFGSARGRPSTGVSGASAPADTPAKPRGFAALFGRALAGGGGVEGSSGAEGAAGQEGASAGAAAPPKRGLAGLLGKLGGGGAAQAGDGGGDAAEAPPAGGNMWQIKLKAMMAAQKAKNLEEKAAAEGPGASPSSNFAIAVLKAVAIAKQPFKWQSIAALDEKAGEFARLGAIEQAKLDGEVHKNLSVRLGEHLKEQRVSANEFFASWSKASYTKVGFRDHVKKLPGVIPPGTDVKDINGLFDSLDADHGERAVAPMVSPMVFAMRDRGVSLLSLCVACCTAHIALSGLCRTSTSARVLTAELTDSLSPSLSVRVCVCAGSTPARDT